MPVHNVISCFFEQWVAKSPAEDNNLKNMTDKVYSGKKK